MTTYDEPTGRHAIVGVSERANDRVRWGAVIAGLFAAMATTIVLTVLGLAIGLSTLDRTDTAAGYGMGAGVWAAVTAIIAFFVGGLFAAKSAGVRGTGNGALQGAMVWIVTIPLLVYFAAGGLSALVGGAGKVAATGTQAASNVAGQAASNPDLTRRATDAAPTTDEAARQATAATQQAATAAQPYIDKAKQAMTPENVENAAGEASKGVWGLLGSLLLGLAASVGGGFVGARDRTVVRVA